MSEKEGAEPTTISGWMEWSKGREKKLIEISVVNGRMKVGTELDRSLTIHMLEFAAFVVETKDKE